MGAARKLQQEIDQVLKKVKEGINTFDDIYEKARPRLRRSFKSAPARTQCHAAAQMPFTKHTSAA